MTENLDLPSVFPREANLYNLKLVEVEKGKRNRVLPVQDIHPSMIMSAEVVEIRFLILIMVVGLVIQIQKSEFLPH